MIAAIPMGFIPVPVPGTRVQVAPNVGNVCGFTVQARAGDVGKVYFGLSNLSTSTMAGVMHLFWPTGGSGGQPQTYEFMCQEDAGNPLKASQFYIDAQTADEGATVTFYQR